MFFFINNEIPATYLDISSDFIISFIVKETTLRYTQSCEISYIDTFYEVKTLWKVFFISSRSYACPEILPDDIVPIPDDFDPSKYSREVFRMYGTDELAEVSLLCDSNLMMHVIDQFGIDVDTEPVDDEHFRATVQLYPSPTFYRWVFGWGGKIKIESPSAVRKEYQTMLRDAIEMV